MPIAAGGLRSIGDERFYTDAAIRMVQHGDILTPYYLGDGRPHFNKPILTYWAVLGSFELFGIHPFASRLPSLLAGCLLLWLTERCAHALFRRRDVALLAVGVLLSNPIFFQASIHATPDIFLGLFLLASLYGFVRILFSGERSLASYLFAYVGAALAVETKGLSGLLPIPFALAFCATTRPRPVRLRDLFEARSVALGVVIASAWFVAVSLRHGGMVFQDFVGDQITAPVQGKPFHPLTNAWFYVSAALSHFLPWLLLLLLRAITGRSQLASFWREHSRAGRFVLGWYLLLLIPFCVPAIQRGRYMLPAYPMLAMGFAAASLHGVDKDASGALVRRASRIVIAAAGLAGLALAIVGAPIDARLVAGGAFLAVVNAALWLGSARVAVGFPPLFAAVSCFLCMATGDSAIASVFTASPERALVRETLARGHAGEVAVLGLEEHAPSIVALWSGGRIVARSLRDDAPSSELAKYSVAYLSQERQEKWPIPGYRIDPCGYDDRHWRARDVRELIFAKDREAVFARMRVPYFLAVRVADAEPR